MMSPIRHTFCSDNGNSQFTEQEHDMAKYGRKASEKVGRAMRERKKGKLKSGSGQKVKSRKQAIAIGLSEARRAGGKVPPKKKSKKKSKRKKR